MNDRIKVICRIRPLNASEISRNEENILKVTSSETLEMEYQNGTMNGRTFQLDAVLDSNTTQEDVFTYIQPLLEGALEGYNCTVFTCKRVICSSLFCNNTYQMDKPVLEKHLLCLDMIFGVWQKMLKHLELLHLRY